MRATLRAAPFALALALALAAPSSAEVVQRGGVRVRFEAEMTPRALPRSGAAPIAVRVGGRIVGGDAADLPRLRRIEVAINRHGSLDRAGLPSCRMRQIQPATTAEALRACGDALVGEGRFSARVLLPEQSPFPSSGRVFAFNGTYRGHPAILAHVYGTEPIPASYTLPFRVTRGRGTFGTVLAVSLPQFTTRWGFVKGLEMSLSRRFRHRGRVRSYVNASCPAPPGFTSAVFRLARVSFEFADGRQVSSALVRSCRVR